MSDRVTRSRSKDRSPNASHLSSSPASRVDNTSYRSRKTYSDEDSDDKVDDSIIDDSQDLVDFVTTGSYSHSESMDSSFSFKQSPKSSPPKKFTSPKSPLYPDLKEISGDLGRRALHGKKPGKKQSPKATVGSPTLQHKTTHKTETVVHEEREDNVRRRGPPKTQDIHTKPRGGRRAAQADLSWKELQKYRNNCIICAIVLVILSLFFLYLSPSNSVSLRSNLDPAQLARKSIVNRFEQEFQLFQSKFTKQSNIMLRTLKAASKSVMREIHPIKPGIIMLAGNKQAFDTVECIAQHVLNISTQAYAVERYAEVRQEDLAKFETYHDVKKYLEDTLRAGFASGKAALIHNLEQVHGKAAMLFHAFCDNENAPFKDSVIIFTVHMDTDENIVDEEQVEAYLDERWREELELDSRSPLMTRIANFVAIVNPETQATLNQYC